MLSLSFTRQILANIFSKRSFSLPCVLSAAIAFYETASKKQYGGCRFSGNWQMALRINRLCYKLCITDHTSLIKRKCSTVKRTHHDGKVCHR